MITEIPLIPVMIKQEARAIFKMHIFPVDFSLIVTVHSHPSVSSYPSEADKILFRKYGKVHMIAVYPFNENSWMAENADGTEIIILLVY